MVTCGEALRKALHVSMKSYAGRMKPTIDLAEGRAPGGQSLRLQQHDGEYFLKIGGVTLMSTTACASEQTMAELACGGQSGKQRVLIGGLGFGFTLKRVLELVSDDSSVEVAELLPEMIAWNRKHLRELNGKLLDEPRVSVFEGDVFRLLQTGGPYDAILLDVDNSPDPLVQRGNGRLYRRRGLEMVRAALTSRGRVVYWSAHPDPAFVTLLRKVFARVEAVPAKAYPKARKFTHTLFVAERGRG
jgi:spermidine synthase